MAPAILDGKLMSEELIGEIGAEVQLINNEHGVTPGLAVVLVGNNPASMVYVRNKSRAAKKVGMNSLIKRLPADASADQIVCTVQGLNRDPKYHGILVQLPLPDYVDEDSIISSIDPNKDVDGLHPMNVGLLSSGIPRFVPATPGGIREILLRTGNNPSGKRVVILGRSNIVGRPLSNLLSMKGNGGDATVTVCHSRSKDLKQITLRADILVAAIGIPDYVTKDMVAEGAVVVDVGINRVEDLSRKNGYRLKGDVDFEQVFQKTSYITPVPGGVGPMTIAMLLSNTLKAAKIGCGIV
jgi:methylenetetrahydrofolate dehydrogenase (NADP+)/methenyltetrahydrofolate cyclohydrolase